MYSFSQSGQNSSFTQSSGTIAPIVNNIIQWGAVTGNLFTVTGTTPTTGLTLGDITIPSGRSAIRVNSYVTWRDTTTNGLPSFDPILILNANPTSLNGGLMNNSTNIRLALTPITTTVGALQNKSAMLTYEIPLGLAYRSGSILRALLTRPDSVTTGSITVTVSYLNFTVA